MGSAMFTEGFAGTTEEVLGEAYTIVRGVYDRLSDIEVIGGMLNGWVMGDNGVPRPLEDILNDGLWFQPEMFMEGVGEGSLAIDQAAFQLMTDECVARNEMLIKLLPKRYVISNPYMFGNADIIMVRGCGAELQNGRIDDGSNSFGAFFAANYSPWQSPVGMMPNGRDILTFGADQGPGIGDYGVRIKSAGHGTSFLETLDGSPFPAITGPVLVYGWDRQGSDTFPVCPSVFEFNEISGMITPAKVQLKSNLQHFYDELAPERPDSGNPLAVYGAARALVLTRANGAFRAFRQPKLLHVSDLHLVQQPGQSTIIGEETVNGAGGFGGADQVILERVTMRRGFISFCRKAQIDNMYTADAFEFDKVIEKIKTKECKFNGLIAGLAVKEWEDENSVIYNDNSVAPTDLRDLDGTSFIGADAFSSTKLIGDYVFGTRRTVARNLKLGPTDATVNGVFVESVLNDNNVIVVDENTIKWTRATWNGSTFFRGLQIERELTDVNGNPLFRITRMGYCTGDQTTGDVFLDGVFLNGGFVSGTPLYLPLNPEIEIDGDPVFEGQYAEQIKTGYEIWKKAKLKKENTDHLGYVTVERFGAVGSDTAVNDATPDARAAIQAAEDYRHANGIPELRFGSRYYALRRRIPASTVYDDIFGDLDGFQLIKRGSSAKWTSTPGRTDLCRRDSDGTALTAADYKVITGYVTKWRGGAVWCQSSGAGVIDPRLGSFTLDGIRFQGGLLKGQDGGAFDITDKGIWQENDQNNGDVILKNGAGVIGFLGELIYLTGPSNVELGKRFLEIDDTCVLGETNLSCLNPNGQQLRVGRCTLYNSVYAMETWTGQVGGYCNAVCIDCTGGSTLQGGMVNQDGGLGGYYVFTEVVNGILPIGTIDMMCVRSPMRFGAGLTGRIVAIDCVVDIVDNTAFQDGSHELDLEIISYCHNQSLTAAVTLLGGNSGSMTHDRTRIRVSTLRSKEAVTGGFSHGAAVAYYGSFGADVVVDVSRCNAVPALSLAAVYDNEPKWIGARYIGAGLQYYDVEANNNATISLLGKGPFIALSCSGGASGVKKLVLPVVGIGAGHEITIFNYTPNFVGGGLSVEIGGLRQASRCVLGQGYVSAKFSFDGGAWNVVEPPPALTYCIGLVDGATVTPDFRAGSNFEWTLAGNRTLANPTNLFGGDTGTIRMTQDGTGSRLITYGAAWKFAAGADTALSTDPGAIDILSYVVRNDGNISAILTKGF